MKPGVKWFKHDHNSSNDEKILELRVEFDNWFAVGLFWALIEKLSSSKDNQLNTTRISGLSLALQVDSKTLLSFIKKCIELDLLQSSGDLFWSDRLNEDMKKYNSLQKVYSERAKAAAEARWGKVKSDKDASSIASSNTSSSASSNGSRLDDASSIPSSTSSSNASAMLNPCLSMQEQNRTEEKRKEQKRTLMKTKAKKITTTTHEEIKRMEYQIDHLKDFINPQDKALLLSLLNLKKDFLESGGDVSLLDLDLIARHYTSAQKASRRPGQPPIDRDEKYARRTREELSGEGSGTWDIPGIIMDTEKYVTSKLNERIKYYDDVAVLT